MPEIGCNIAFADYLKEAFLKQFAKTSATTDTNSQKKSENKEKQEYEKEITDRSKPIDIENLDPNRIYNIYDLIEAYEKYLNDESADTTYISNDEKTRTDILDFVNTITNKFNDQFSATPYIPYDKSKVINFLDFINDPKNQVKSNFDESIPIADVSLEKLDIYTYYNNHPEEEYAALLREFSNIKSTTEWAYVGLEECKLNFDTTNHYEFLRLTEETDLTGLSDTEKYMTISDKYKYCFGDDFLNSFSLGTPIPNLYLGILKRFSSELTEQFGTAEAVQKVYRQAEYGNMTDAQIRAEIIDKYPPKGERTYRDIMYMSYEMNRAGVDNGLFGNGLLQDAAKSYGSKTAADYAETLDKKVGNDYEAKVWKLFENRTKYTLPTSIGTVISEIFA
jgi:hypothetical protein